MIATETPEQRVKRERSEKLSRILYFIILFNNLAIDLVWCQIKQL